MNETQFELVQRIFALAIERPVEDRRDLLLRECGSDRTVRAEVESLLRHHHPTRELLPERLLDERFHVACFAAGGTGRPPEAFDGFRIIRLIGQGGMGVVYEAEQEHPRRRVALKVMKEEISSESSLARFDREVKALARLSHPGIPQIIAAGLLPGLTGQRPYLAMELVSGTPLLAYAMARELDVRARVGLLLAVCAAMAHAHRQGVIHRDLKSDNVLVDDEPDGPRVRVLDFGVSRLMDEPVQVVTQAGGPIGTPAYMSPEQLLGRREDVDARSDVYSLGVAAFELLTGVLPFPQRRNMAEAVSRAATEAAAPLSRHDRRLRGDLETIVGCCLEADSSRRYGSIEGLERDLRRYLAGRPIGARPQSLAYSLSLLARRHRLAVAIGAVSALLLLATAIGLGLTVRQLLQARARMSQGQLDRLERVVNLVETTAQTLGPAAGARESLRALLTRAEQDLAELHREQLRDGQDDSVARQLIAQIWLRLSVIDHAEGKRADAFRRRQQAHELTQPLFDKAQFDEKLARQMALNYVLIGDILNEDGESRAAQEWFSRAEAIHRRQLLLYPDDIDRLDDMTWTCFRNAGVLYALGDSAGAIDLNTEGLAVNERQLHLDPMSSRSLRGQWNLIEQRAKLAYLIREFTEYSERILSLRSIAERLADLHPNDHLAIQCVLYSRWAVGLHLMELSRIDEAKVEFQYGLALALEWERREPGVKEARELRCGFEDKLYCIEPLEVKSGPTAVEVQEGS